MGVVKQRDLLEKDPGQVVMQMRNGSGRA